MRITKNGFYISIPVIMLVILVAVFISKEKHIAVPLDQSYPVEESIYEVYGKYMTYEVTLKNDPTKAVVATCSALVVSWGDDYIISKYIDRVKNGDWVNQINKYGQLVLNFKLDGLSEGQRKLLNEDKILKLKIRRSPRIDNEGAYCGNYIDVVDVEEYVAEVSSSDGLSKVRVPMYITKPYPYEPIPEINCPEGMIPYSIVGHGDTKTSCSPPPPPQEGDRVIGDGSQTYQLTGYYHEYNHDFYPLDYDPERDIGYPKIFVCKGFLVTGGDQDFIRAYKENIKSAKIVDGNPVLNLNNMIVAKSGSEIPSLVLGEIASSTKDRQVTVEVKVHEFPGRDTSPCDTYGIYMPVE